MKQVINYFSDCRRYCEQIIHDAQTIGAGLPAGPEGAKERETRTMSVALRAVGSLTKVWCAYNTLRQFALLLVLPAEASVLALFAWAIAGILAHDLAVMGMRMQSGIKQRAENLLHGSLDRVRDAAHLIREGGLSTDNLARATEAVVTDTPFDLSGTLILRHLYPYVKRGATTIIARAEAARVERQ